MRSSIYINELVPGVATIDFSLSPSALVDEETCYGFAFMKTLEHLGIAYQVEKGIRGLHRLNLSGSQERIGSNLPRLQQEIGMIARDGAERIHGIGREFERRWIVKILGDLAQYGLAEMSEDAPFTWLAGAIAEPFAAATNDEGVSIYYGDTAPWRKTWPEHKHHDETIEAVASRFTSSRLHSSPTSGQL